MSNLLKNCKVEKNVIVNWTGTVFHKDDPDPAIVLNEHSFTNKLRQALRLSDAGVPTITVALQGNGKEWIPRRNNHQQGFDFTNTRLRRGQLNADFYVKKEDIVEEWRAHVFLSTKGNMRILRTAKKVQNRPDAHSWVRSHRLGWKLSYVGGLSDVGKQIARDALRALHLDFGAVDIGFRKEGDPFILEVNTCPGLEGKTINLYVNSIIERAVL